MSFTTQAEMVHYRSKSDRVYDTDKIRKSVKDAVPLSLIPLSSRTSPKELLINLLTHSIVFTP